MRERRRLEWNGRSVWERETIQKRKMPILMIRLVKASMNTPNTKIHRHCIHNHRSKSNSDSNASNQISITHIQSTSNCSETSILSVCYKTPSSLTKVFCNHYCLTIVRKRSAHHFCTNMACGFYETRLSRPQFTEIVSLNVRQKIQSIVLLNFSHYAELFPDFDTPFSKRYQ